MTRVIHTGDTHIGYRQYHSPQRRQDFLAAFRRVVQDAIDDGVRAVIHAGDLFHDRRPDLQDILGVLGILRELDAAGIPFLAVVGNHEAKRDAQWLDLFESLGLATRLGDEPVVIDDVAVYGLDFVPRSQREDIEYGFAPHDAAHAVLVTHGLFQPFDYGDWDAGDLLERAPVDFDAMLLGDNHHPGRKEVDGTWITYCGSTERVSADERADRGYNIVAFDAEGVHISRRGVETRPFAFVDVELVEGEGSARVRDRVAEHDLEDAVAIITIEGAGEAVTPADIEEFARERGAMVARVTDKRELAEERDVDVSFADPDDAVRSRIRELGLSDAARGIDETVRASKVADSNVRDVVEERVRELVESDPAAFTTATAEADPESEDGGEPEAEPDGTGAESVGSEPEPEPETEAESESEPEPGSEPDAESDEGEGGTSIGTGGTAATDPGAAEATPEGEIETDGDADPAAESAGEQASMEEYL